MEELLSGYHISLGDIERSVIDKSLAMCAYMYAKEQHPFALRAHELGLLNARMLYYFRDKLEALEGATVLRLGKGDTIRLYSLVDLCCKAYLCGIGDRLTAATGKQGEEGERIRNFFLHHAENLLTKLRSELTGDTDFAEQLYLLWQLNAFLLD